MNDGVLDTCVLIAVLRRERIEEEALSLIAGGSMSTVNLAELYSKLTPEEWPLRLR
jgi:PIN domain nuclease of toxin-antitoxin system